MPVDAFNAATPLDSDQAMEAAAELRALKLRLNNVAFFQNGAPVTDLANAWQLDFTGTGVALSVAGNVLTIAGLGAVLPPDLVASNSLHVGTGSTIKTASYLGTAQEYYEAKTLKSQRVTFKQYTGPVFAADLGKTSADTNILHYDAQTDLALNPVSVVGANQVFTANVGTLAAARGSVINLQGVVDVFGTDTSDGPNEYANSVFFLRLQDGHANSGNVVWQNDWSVHGSRTGADHILVGTTELIARLNTAVPSSGQPSAAYVATTRPRGGAQPLTVGWYTFPIAIGYGVSGFSGINDTAVNPHGYSAAADYGFEVAYQAGGNIGPWMGEYPNGSKIRYGFAARDYTDYAFVAYAAHPHAVGGQRAFYAASGAGHIEIQTGTWNADHVKLGGISIWNNGGIPYYKNGVPAGAADGTPWPAGGGVTSLTGTAGQVDVNAATGAVTVSAKHVNRAFCLGNGAGGFVHAGYGCSSNTRTGAGAYTVALTTAINNPVAQVTPVGTQGYAIILATSTSTTMYVACFNAAGAATDMAFSLTVMSAS